MTDQQPLSTQRRTAKEIIQRQGEKLIEQCEFHDGLVLLEMAKVLINSANSPNEDWRLTAVDWVEKYQYAMQKTAGVEP